MLDELAFLRARRFQTVSDPIPPVVGSVMGTQRSQLSEQCWLKSEARDRVWRHAELTAERVVHRRDQEDHHRDEHFWGVPQAHMMFVQRKGTTVERFPPWIRTALGFVLCLGSARFSLTPNRLRL
jgi:hypothetical protein